MRRSAIVRFAAAAIVLGVASPAYAQWVKAVTQEMLPPITQLSCEGNCPSFQPAQLDSRAVVQYPHDMAGHGSEGVVDLAATIGTDGVPSNILIDHLDGPDSFADAARQALSQEKFRPAMEGAKPVAQNIRVRFTFHFPDSEGARRPLAEVYERFHRMLDRGHSAEALSLLRATLARDDLNLYERSMFAYSLATLMAQQKQVADGLAAIRDATVDEGRFLGDDVREGALRLRIHLEAQAGNFGDALIAYDVLSKIVSIPSGDGDSVLMVNLHKLIEGPQMLPASGNIASKDIPWGHTLVRRTFAFDGIHGQLDKFDLRCDTHSLSAPVNDTSEFTVPQTWSGCRVYVSGTPGATFQLVELPPKSANTAAPSK